MDISVSAPISTNAGTGTQFASSSSPQEEKSLNYTQQEQKQIAQLKARDRVVRAHEAAHVAAGAGIVKGGASFTYQQGPDGKRYAIGGEVSIDTSEIANNPQATLRKAQQIRAAALAPAQPSSADRAIAAKAAQMAVEARAEIAQERREELEKIQSTDESTETIPPPNENTTGSLLDLTV